MHRDQHAPHDQAEGPPGFADFVATRYPELVRLGALLTGDAHHGEDLAQLGLMAVLRAWRRLHPHGHPEAYARVTMTRLAARDRRRRWTGEKPTDALPDLPTISTPEPASIEATIDAQRLLARLPTAQRLVLVMRFWLDMSEQDTAEALDCSLGTVKSRTSRALKALRTLTAQADTDPRTGLHADASGSRRRPAPGSPTNPEHEPHASPSSPPNPTDSSDTSSSRGQEQVGPRSRNGTRR